jgi:hypothetical protein
MCSLSVINKSLSLRAKRQATKRTKSTTHYIQTLLWMISSSYDKYVSFNHADTAPYTTKSPCIEYPTPSEKNLRKQKIIDDTQLDVPDYNNTMKLRLCVLTL